MGGCRWHSVGALQWSAPSWKRDSGMTPPIETLQSVAPGARARRELGVGVIGFGWLGQVHSRSMLRIPTLFADREFDARLVVCADAVPARTQDAVRSFGFEKGTQDWRRVMDEADVDIVVI